MTQKKTTTKTTKDKVQVTIDLNPNCILDLNIHRVKDNNNRYLTSEMFDDHPDNRRTHNKIAPYSLYEHEDMTYENGMVVRSMRKIFLSLDDETGYECAITCFGNIDHWNKCLNSSKIKEEVDKWKQELQLKELALIKKACLSEIKTSGRSSMQAAKTLISLNNQDPNSLTNREKAIQDREDKAKEGAKTKPSSNLTEQQRKLMEDYKRLNG